MRRKIEEQRLCYFGSLFDKEHTYVTFAQLVEIIRSDVHVKSLSDGYRTTGKKELKRSMPAFLPACDVDHERRKANVRAVSGFCLFDADHLDDEQMVRVRRLAATDPHVVLGYTTMSGRGYHVIYSFELDESLELTKQMQYFSKAFAFGNRYFSSLFGCEFDPQCKDIIRLSACANDPDVLFRPEAVPFSGDEVAPRKERLVKSARREVNKLDNIFSKIVLPQLEKSGILFAPVIIAV
jgi:hypothetical protein